MGLLARVKRLCLVPSGGMQSLQVAARYLARQIKKSQPEINLDELHPAIMERQVPPILCIFEFHKTLRHALR